MAVTFVHICGLCRPSSWHRGTLDYEDLPPRIDRSLMVGMSGGAQTTTLAALREFGMIEGEGNSKTGVLDSFVKANEEELPGLFEALVRWYYKDEIALSDRKGTAAQLEELFGSLYGLTGATRRKAVTFFLHAARYAKITLSPHFKAPDRCRRARGLPREGERLFEGHAAPAIVRCGRSQQDDPSSGCHRHAVLHGRLV